jgi:hypothetical protein
MSHSALVIVVWSTMLSALENVIVVSSTSSVSGFGVEVVSVSLVSGLGSYTSAESKVSANNLCTVVVVPEVVGGQWSPFSILSFSVYPTIGIS